MIHRPDEREIADPATRLGMSDVDPGAYVKDNIMVAGLSMTNGAHLLDGYVQRHDATVVRRVLAGTSDTPGDNA